MIDLFDTAEELQSFFFGRKWKFCFIGGLALQRWGEPRVTQDVDCTLYTGFDNEESFISELTERYASRIDNAEEFALANRVLLLQSKSGIGIDIALGGIPYERGVRPVFGFRVSSLYRFANLQRRGPDHIESLRRSNP